MKVAVRLCSVVLILLVATSTAAGSPSESDPKALDEKAREYAAKEQWDEAIELWRSALGRVTDKHARIIHTNIGRAYQKWGKFPQAWYYLTRAAKLNPGDAKVTGWRAEVEKALREQGLCRTQVMSQPPGATVSAAVFGEEEALATPFVWWFPVGSHVVSFEKAGYGKQAKTLELADCTTTTFSAKLKEKLIIGAVTFVGDLQGATVRIDNATVAPDPAGIRLKPGTYEITVDRPGAKVWSSKVVVKAGETAEVRVPEALEITPPPGTTKSPWWTYSTFGVGTAAVVAGTITYIAARSRLNDVDEKYSVDVGSEQAKQDLLDQHAAEIDDRVRPLETASYVLWGVGGAAALVGGILAFGKDWSKSASSDKTAGRSPLSIYPVFPSGAGLELTF